MKKTIALLASLDTKSNEISFMRNLVEQMGHNPFIIDVGARVSPAMKPDITALEVARSAGVNIKSLMELSKLEMIEILKSGIKNVVRDLFNQKRINGILSIGGLQNTVIAVEGMMELSIGFPKIMVSTVASGKRSFESIVGSKDIIVIPSIVDFTGSNMISDTILTNAVAAMVGMVEKAGKPIDPTGKFIIGATLMGVVNDGVAGAVEKVRNEGFEVLSFHSTGVGGGIMEELIRSGMIHAVMDFSLHEMVCECFGGYSSGSDNRLVAAGEAGIPQIIAVGAVDFLDYETGNIPISLEDRKYLKHNAGLYHIKAKKEEILKVGNLIAHRLNEAKGPVTVLLPLRGFRQATEIGEALYDPEVDAALIEFLKKELKPHIRIVEIDSNINGDGFIDVAVKEVLNLISDNTERKG
ncbi:Tm-1-like ATP-binding domain-containing protein [Oceanispirochaeta sp.]|jgi:uncharacterized protein (UPF0261 family)|uniref:Tm-1-like ATP-binding domain-containing protein n=1 Tax=Oceanispirochaeta sp. TaxID=2035350 RepID=UPI00263334FC|nr:Tm-1-like ATP-binding domain-containing protein [Oceanispirochaeta sp.]MDA3957633.1 Tm-1-like ATP-binding domain-containing protein [Oceanispirochaeta sp.]